MRIVAAVTLLFSMMVLTGIWTSYTLGNTSTELVALLEELKEDLSAKQWDRAQEKVISLEKTWKTKTDWWPIILDHQSVDQVDIAMARLKEFVAVQDESLTRGQLSELKLLLKRIYDREKVNLENIL